MNGLPVLPPHRNPTTVTANNKLTKSRIAVAWRGLEVWGKRVQRENRKGDRGRAAQRPFCTRAPPPVPLKVVPLQQLCYITAFNIKLIR